MTWAAQTAVETTQGRRRSPYPGLVPFATEDAAWFFGRDEWSEVIVDNLRAYRVSVLYGASGVGKSSLLNAGVVPRLDAEARRNFARDGVSQIGIVVFAGWSVNDPLRALKDAACLAFLDGRPADGSLADVLSACADRIGGTVCVVLDQFEEHFLYHGQDETGKAFEEELADALRRRRVPANVVLSIREDSLAKLDLLQARLPNLLDNLIRVEHLDQDAAREAVERPLEEYNRRADPDEQIAIEPALVTEVLEQVRIGSVRLSETGGQVPDQRIPGTARVEAPYLQLVLSRLWDEEERTGSHTLRLVTLEALGGAERIVRTHLDVAMDALAPAERDLAARVFRYLVTPSGAKIAHRPADLAEYAECPVADVTRVLDELSAGELRILRPVGEEAYEIYHDALAAPIADWRVRYALARAEARAASRRRRLLRLVLAVGIPIVLLAVVVPIVVWRHQADQNNAAELKAYLAAARAEPNVAAVMTGHGDAVWSAAFNRDGTRIVSASTDRTARIWQAGRQIARLKANGPLLAAAFSPDGRFVVTAGTDKNAQVWDWSGDRVVTELRGHQAGLDDAEFSPDGKLIVTASDDETARIWDWRGARELAVLDGEGVTRSASFSPDGKRVVTASDDGKVRVWDWANRRVISVLPASIVGTAYDANFSADGSLVVTAGQDGSARVWDPQTGRRTVLPGVKGGGSLRSASFSPNGSLVVTGGGDNFARVWDWRSRRVILKLHDSDGITSVSFSPDGRHVVTSSTDATVRLWHVDSRD